MQPQQMKKYSVCTQSIKFTFVKNTLENVTDSHEAK
jgi:hypothetical protein